MPEDNTSERLEYEDQLRRVRAELAEPHLEFLDGKAKPLDVEALMARVRARVACSK